MEYKCSGWGRILGHKLKGPEDYAEEKPVVYCIRCGFSVRTITVDITKRNRKFVKTVEDLEKKYQKNNLNTKK